MLNCKIFGHKFLESSVPAISNRPGKMYVCQKCGAQLPVIAARIVSNSSIPHTVNKE